MVRRVLYTVFIRTYSLARVVHDHLRRQPTDNAFGDHGGSDMDPTAQVGHGNDGQPLVGHFHAKPKQRQTWRAKRPIHQKSRNEPRSSSPPDALSLTTMSSSRARPTKRQRTFGAPTEDDDPTTQLSQVRYKNAASTRSVGGPLPTLTTYCARAFARHVGKLSADPNAWKAVLSWLKLIPEPLVPKLFAMLKSTHPTLLRSEFIVCVSTHA